MTFLAKSSSNQHLNGLHVMLISKRKHCYTIDNSKVYQICIKRLSRRWFFNKIASITIGFVKI
jgi:hypothetical protein